HIRPPPHTYATHLIPYIRTQMPADASLDDVLGGRKINQITSAAVRNTSLPYQTPGVTPTVWTSIPNNYKATLRFQYYTIDQTFYSADIYGQRLTLWWNGGSNKKELRLNGNMIATGPSQSAGGTYQGTISVVQAYASTFANQSSTFTTFGNALELIGNSWGVTGRQLIDIHKRALDQNRSAGGAEASESIL